MLVLDLYTDGITRSVRFVIESDRAPERAVGLQSKEGIVSVSDSTHQVISQYRSGIRIGRIEFPDHGPYWLVLVKRKRSSRTQSTGWVVRRRFRYVGYGHGYGLLHTMRSIRDRDCNLIDVVEIGIRWVLEIRRQSKSKGTGG